MADEDKDAGAETLVKNDNTDWINKKWRPAMGWIYMLTCTADFVIFPVLWSILQTLQGGQVFIILLWVPFLVSLHMVEQRKK